MRRISLVVVMAWALLAGGGAMAEQPLNDLFQTEAVYPQEAGEVQLTLRPSFEHGDEADVTRSELGIEYGITDSWQLELAFPGFVHSDPNDESSTTGIGDLEIGAKYSFMNIAESGFHAALAFEVTLPTGDPDRELGEGFVEYEPSLILAKDFPEWHGLQLFSQLGFSFVDRVRGDDDEPEAHELALNAGVIVPWRKWAFVGELNWATNEWNNGGEENELYFTPGVVRRLPGGWELGLGVPIGLNAGADDFRVIGSLIFEFDF